MLWRSGGLDQYGAEPFEQQQFGTAGVEGVKYSQIMVWIYTPLGYSFIRWGLDRSPHVMGSRVRGPQKLELKQFVDIVYRFLLQKR